MALDFSAIPSFDQLVAIFIAENQTVRKLTSGSSMANPDPGAEPDHQIPRLTVALTSLRWMIFSIAALQSM
jgi:hypothetical protein